MARFTLHAGEAHVTTIAEKNIVMKGKYNFFAMPLIVNLVLTSYVTVALVNSGYFYETPVLFFSFGMFFIWFFAYVVSEIRKKTFFKFSKLKLAILFSAFFLGFYYVKHIWFSGYLNLDPMAIFLEGKSHIDTLYHSDIAESFITNGYPSIQFNNSPLLHYHVISHFILSVISRVLYVPCFVTYNYIYPVLFLPLYVFLLQVVVVSFRKYLILRGENLYDIKDVIFLLCICFGFNFFNVSDKGYFWYDSIIGSESCLIAVIFILVAFSLSFFLKDKNAFIVAFILNPFFIFLVSGAKISCGLIFSLACAYYFFRKSPKSIINWLVIIIYAFTFVISYFVFNDSISSDASSNSSLIYPFHFIRSYVPLKYWLLHYYIYIIPSFFILRYGTKGKILSKEYLCEKSNVWPEMAFLLTICSWLPGILLEIGGGSAEYFCFPAFVISVLILQGLDVHVKIYESIKKNANVNLLFVITIFLFLCQLGKFKKVFELFILVLLILWGIDKKLNFSFYKNSKRFVLFFLNIRWIIIILLFTALFIPEIKNSEIKITIHEALTLSNINTLQELNGKFIKLKKVLGKSDYLIDNRYKAIKEIRKLVKNNRKNYCIFMSDNCYLYNLYGDYTNNPAYVMKGDFAAAALFGLPVINAIYSDLNNRYRGDGRLEWKSGLREYYGLTTVQAEEKVSLENMRTVAYKLGYSNIIILEGDSYRVE